MQNLYTDIFYICNVCHKAHKCGDICQGKEVDSNQAVVFAKYATAMKEAINCWQNADCDEHQSVCQPKVKEFAHKIMELQDRVNLLESAIIKHRDNKKDPNQQDVDLWRILT
jgi:hypothetical protein